MAKLDRPGNRADGNAVSLSAAAGDAGQIAAGTTPGIDAIGRVETISGHVFVVRADGTRVELALGSRLHDGDIIETGADGIVGIVLADETSLAMGADGCMVLDEMIYDQDTKEGSLSLSVVKGIYTIVSGLASKTDPNAMKIETPVGSIGIRGTQLGIDLADGRNLNVVMMREGDGYVGEVFIRNAAGLLVMNQAHQVVFVGGGEAQPTLMAPIDNGSVARMFESTLAHLPQVSGRENDYGTYGTRRDGNLETFDTRAGRGDAEGTGGLDDTIRVVEGDYTKPRTTATVAVAVPETPAPEAETPVAPAPRQEPAVPPAAAPMPETNEGPLAFDESVATREDEAISGQLTAFDPDNDPLTYALTETGAPQHGSVTINPDGTFTYTPEADFAGVDRFTYLVSDGRGGTTVATATVEIAPVADVPVLTVGSSSGAEDAPIPIDIAADVPGKEELASVTIGGLPAGAQLSAGTDNGDGTWTLSGDDLDQLGALTVTPPAHSSSDITLQVTATSTDGGGGSDTLIGRGGNDVLFGDSSLIGAVTVPVDIQASLSGDVDGSESLGVTVAGVPDGATLSAGTDLGGGAWSLGADDLAGLSMTLPEGYRDDFQLQVTANALDTDADSGATDIATAAAPLSFTFAGGAPGDDLLRGGSGDDVLYGGAGSDDLRGEADNDVLYGESGEDALSGGGGSDVLYGGTGNDALAGDAGGDILHGEAGDDVLSGGGGADVLYGGAGSDRLEGDQGDDALYGGEGADRLEGGGGDDALSGGAGDDVLVGGSGNQDSFVFQPGGGHDTVEDYRAGETLRFEGPEFSHDNVSFTQNGDHVQIMFDDHPDMSVTVNDVDLSRGYEITPDPESPGLIVTFKDSS